MNPTAVIVGCAGQDGVLLTRLLTGRGYRVVGVAREGTRSAERDLDGRPLDICDADAVAALVQAASPREIYFLAGHHHSSEEHTGDDRALLRDSHATHVAAFVNFLDAAARHAPAARTFYAASSHVFGKPSMPVQDETTPLLPDSIYAITKAEGLFLCRYFRERRAVFVSGGILYNHESSLRAERFVSQRIARGAARIARGRVRGIAVGNLEAATDWGYAPDYVEAMHRILNIARPDDFVVATGETHTVREMAQAAFACVGLDYREHVTEDASIVRRSPARLCGNPAKLRRETGWRPSIGFEQMVEALVQAELSRLDGE
jgi:GDPmannose 4,6-dehydratase